MPQSSIQYLPQFEFDFQHWRGLFACLRLQELQPDGKGFQNSQELQAKT